MRKSSDTPYFYPRPPRGGRPPSARPSAVVERISIHALREEGDAERPAIGRCGKNFYPRPPRGGRPPTPAFTWAARRYFYPRPPRGGRPYRVSGKVQSVGHFYPRPPRGGRPCRPPNLLHCLAISIHALREEGDYLRKSRSDLEAISIHALREEGDFKKPFVVAYLVPFLSTPSARRATAAPLRCCKRSVHFYPRPPRGGRLFHRTGAQTRSAYFYPRPPRGGRPFFNGFDIPGYLISIHALREEGDQGGRPMKTLNQIFLSTPSARRATAIFAVFPAPNADFYPRPPRGGRPLCAWL